MSIYHWILLGGFAVFLVTGFSAFFSVLSKKGIKDYSVPRGNVNSAIAYSFTGAMSPVKKESAYMHLPIYTAGMFFHIGTFLSFFCLAVLFFDVKLSIWLTYIFSVSIFTAGLCGIGILIKRIIKLRSLSNPDDYFSNMLVTGFQIITAATILFQYTTHVLFIYGAFLFLYIPAGKLKHTIYFFTSRIHLGMFYGRRAVWPPKNK